MTLFLGRKEHFSDYQKVASCKAIVTADSGIDVSGGGTYGIDQKVRVAAALFGRAAITRVQVTRTDTGPANTADLADGAVSVGDRIYPFSVTDGKAAMTLTAEENLAIHFFSNGKLGEQPLIVRVSGDKGANLVGSRVEVRRGNDADIIADAERGHVVIGIRLENGTQFATGYVSEERIWLGGCVSLVLAGVQANMRVHFSSNLDEEHIPVTVLDSTGVDIDKGCGGTVTYTVTP